MVCLLINLNLMKKHLLKISFSCVAMILLSSCSHYSPGPDKQGAGIVSGILAGAGTGAVTGLHMGAGLGPGAAVGAGFGAIAGGVKGVLQDWVEEDMRELKKRAKYEKQVSYAHRILSEHYKRRIELHPARDIYPADWFFDGDSATIKESAKVLIDEIARLNKKRFPWSRLVVVTYIKTVNKDSSYAKHLALKRSRELGNYFVRSGIEPRRIETRPVLVDAPVLIDPYDDPKRYSQAIELIPVDK